MKTRYIFVDTVHKRVAFELRANGDIEYQGVTNMSVYCMKAAIMPSDIEIFIEAPSDITNDIRSKTEALYAKYAYDRLVHLTRRELELAAIFVRTPGIQNKEIGTELNLSERTVKFHVSSMLEKFEVKSRAALYTKLAMDHFILEKIKELDDQG